METLQTAISLIIESMVLSARWASRRRMDYLVTASRAQSPPARGESRAALLEARVECLSSQVEILKTRLAELKFRKP